MFPNPVPLPLALSDKRAYVFAADLFDALAATERVARPAILRLTRVSNEAIEQRFDRPRPEDPAYCGSFHHGSGSERQSSWLRIRSGEILTDRLPDSDQAVLTAPRLGADWASATLTPRFSIAKTALVLAIALIEEAYPADLWDLAELQAHGPFQDEGQIRITLGRRLNRFLVLSVFVNDINWGQFTLASTPIEEPSLP